MFRIRLYANRFTPHTVMHKAVKLKSSSRGEGFTPRIILKSEVRKYWDGNEIKSRDLIKYH